MDADDVAMPERLASHVQYLEKHPDVGAVSSWYQMVDATGTERGTLFKLPEHHAEIEWEMTKHCSLCFPALMVRKEILDRAGMFNEKLQSAIDYEWFLRLIAVAHVANIPAVLLLHRRHEHSISSDFLGNQQSNKYNFAREYLLRRLQEPSGERHRCTMYLRLGVNDYYYGSMKQARTWFFKSLPSGLFSKIFWRYFPASFLGDGFFVYYRRRYKHF
jgi:hypothetical protein